MKVNGQLHVPARAPCTNWLGGCVGPQANLDGVVKREKPCQNQTLLVKPVLFWLL